MRKNRPHAADTATVFGSISDPPLTPSRWREEFIRTLCAAINKMPFGLLVVAMVAIPHLVVILSHWHDVPLKPGALIGSADPDPWLRLMIVRDWLQGGGWYHHVIDRSNAPWGGIASPWTRPLDMVIAVLYHLQWSDADMNTRLIRAAMLVPWVCMTLLMAGMVRAIRVICPITSALFMGVALLASAPLMWNYFSLAYSDHHSMLAALFVWAMGGVLMRAPTPRVLIATGMMLGLMLWISPEALALIGMIYVWYGLEWLLGEPRQGRQLAVLASATALMSMAAVMIERPIAAWGVPIYDSISMVYVFILSSAALLAWVLTLIAPPSFSARLALTVIGGGLLVATLWSVYPLAFKGPLAEVEPYIFTRFLPNITEAQPLFHKNTVLVSSLLVHPVLALLVCGFCLWRRDGYYSRGLATKLAFFLVVTMVLFLAQVRWCYYFYPIVALVIAPWMGALFTPRHVAAQGRWPARLLAGCNETQQMARRLPILILVFALPIWIAIVVPNEDSRNAIRHNACSTSVRKLIYGGALANLVHGKPLTLFASTDFGGEILFWTPHRIIASNYHREGKGIEYIWETEPVDNFKALRARLAERRVDALLICPDANPVEGSVIEAMQRGAHIPNWLTPVPFVTQEFDEHKKPVADARPAVFLVNH